MTAVSGTDVGYVLLTGWRSPGSQAGGPPGSQAGGVLDHRVEVPLAHRLEVSWTTGCVRLRL